MKALLVVDVQNDFTPGGPLATELGDAIVPTINELMDKFPLVVSSRDWHAAQCIHFEIWPVHCVENTVGAEFDKLLDHEKIDQDFLKGTDPNTDSGYSAFEATSKNLDEYLREKGVTELYVVGIATEFCVKASVLDAIKLGYKTYVITDAISPVSSENAPAALQEMRDQNAILVGSAEIVG